MFERKNLEMESEKQLEKLRLFCVEIAIEAQAENTKIVHHVVAIDSEDAFKQTENFCKEKNIISLQMQCSIVKTVGQYQIQIVKKD